MTRRRDASEQYDVARIKEVTTELLNSLGLSKDEYAKLIRVSFPTLQKMLNGEATPRTPAVALIMTIGPIVGDLLESGLRRESVLAHVRDMLDSKVTTAAALDKMRRFREILDITSSQVEQQSTRPGGRIVHEMPGEADQNALGDADIVLTRWHCPSFNILQNYRRRYEVLAEHHDPASLGMPQVSTAESVCVTAFAAHTVDRETIDKALGKLQKIIKQNRMTVILCGTITRAARSALWQDSRSGGSVQVIQLQSLTAEEYADFLNDTFKLVPQELHEMGGTLLTFHDTAKLRRDFQITLSKDLITLDLHTVGKDTAPNPGIAPSAIPVPA
ncbi:MAG: hypothetical protein H6506_03800 [Calditrichaeota bacterium]|nr:hypothetical protein [Calditrichota bacterium]MCB9391757.1 hypothetical protein [Calditrichota bacterium]